MRSGDLFGDLGQGRIVHPGIFEPIFSDCDGVSTAVPLANETRPWLEAEARSGANPTGFPQSLRYSLQLAARCLTQPAVFDFLKSVTEPQDKEATADLWRLTVVQPPPFETQLLRSERPDAIELALDRICAAHGYAAAGAAILGFNLDLTGLPEVTR